MIAMKKTIYIVFLFLLSLTQISEAAPPYFSLYIILPRESGTGTQANIPATNRIFKAYPGIEYNIRAAVIGGTYPYTYSLSNAPTGMSIDSRTGEIVWTNPQSNASNIQLSVEDADGNSTSTTWDITVTENGFIFVDSSHTGTESGTLNEPYSSLYNMLQNESTTSDIVYFRDGSYELVDFNSGASYVMNLDSSPRTWIGYPDETAVLQGGTGGTPEKAHRIILFYEYWMDNLNFYDFSNYGIRSLGTNSYRMVRRCLFDGLVPEDDVNNNYGYLQTDETGTFDYYFVVQDNEFTDWCGSSAIGSLYEDNYMLIENNHIHTPRGSCPYSGIGSTNGIAPKSDINYLTVRGNKVLSDKNYVFGGNNAAFFGGEIEICFNLFVKTDSSRELHLWDWSGTQGNTYYWHNTLIGDFRIRFDDASVGPYTVHNNVISNPNTDYSGYTSTDYFLHHSNLTLSDVLTDTDNLKDTTASNLVDSADEYKLVSGQSSYVGTRGWQLSDGLTPMELDESPDTTAPAVSGTVNISNPSSWQ